MSRKSCSACGTPLGAQFLKAGQLHFHQGCFRCGHCSKPLDRAFTQQKGGIYHVECYKQKFKVVCAHCCQTLDDQWLTFEGKKLHPSCYQQHYMPHCVHCGGGITGQFHRDESGSWHVQCYERTQLEPCSACGGPLKGKIMLDPWGHKAHAVHGNQKTHSCSVCARLISQKTSQGGTLYGDGRAVCGICGITEVSTPAQISQIKADVLARLQSVGFDYIPDYIAVNLADQRLMNQRLGVHKTANSHGYTKTLEKRINGQVTREHSIFVLFGLPRLVFAGVLAHELLHVWLNERGLQQGSEKEIEGFCNLGTALIYQQDGTPLAKVLLERMAKDTGPVYGDGYRLMLARLNKLGWPALIAAMQQPPSGVQASLQTGAKSVSAGINKLNRFIDRFI